MPIVVPGKDYTQSWNALADVFGNYAQTREDAYQRQRQKILDAQRLAAHEQQMINAKLLGDKRRFELDQLQSAENLVSDDLDTLAELKFAADGGGQVRSNRPGYGVDKAKNQLAYAQAARKILLQKAGYVQTQILQNEQAQRQALAAGDTRAVRELQIKKLEFEAESKRLQNEQDIKWDKSVGIATGDIKKPGMIPHTRSDAPGYTVDPRSYRPDDPEWKQAEKYYTAYGPKSQADFATIADVASGRRNWDTSLDKSGYTVAQTNTLADTFASQFETQFNDSDGVTKREAEKMASYALAAAKQIFNNPNIPLPPGTTALDLYNQILNQRDLYATDGGWNAFGIGNTNYEPITEVATIIENWKNLNSAERPPGDQEQATNNVTFTGINKQTGKQVTVTQEELIAAARERYPHMSIEVAIAKVKQDLGIQ